MFKQIIRLTLPLVVLVLIALYLVLSPVFATHAAAPLAPVRHVSVSHNFTSSNGIKISMYWRP
jgi:hypothetical protein